MERFYLYAYNLKSVNMYTNSHYVYYMHEVYNDYNLKQNVSVDDICFCLLPDVFRSSVCDLHQRLVKGLFVALKYFISQLSGILPCLGRSQKSDDYGHGNFV